MLLPIDGLLLLLLLMGGLLLPMDGLPMGGVLLMDGWAAAAVGEPVVTVWP